MKISALSSIIQALREKAIDGGSPAGQVRKLLQMANQAHKRLADETLRPTHPRPQQGMTTQDPTGTQKNKINIIK